jgi:hypothetical protein
MYKQKCIHMIPLDTIFLTCVGKPHDLQALQDDTGRQQWILTMQCSSRINNDILFLHKKVLMLLTAQCYTKFK